MAQRVAQHVVALDDGAATIRALYAVGHVDAQGSLVAYDYRPFDASNLFGSLWGLLYRQGRQVKTVGP
jgi:hypothetical protein